MSPKLACFSIANILGNVGKCWEIEVSTHLPLHLEQCHKCNRFVQHITDCCKGSLDSFVKIQKDHWIKELDNVFLNVFNNGYDKAMNKNRARENELMNTIGDLCKRIQDLEQDSTHSAHPDVQPMDVSTPPRSHREHKWT